MKSLTRIGIGIFLFMSIILRANPVIQFFLYELLLDSESANKWKLEMRTNGINEPESWFLTTQSDTAFFKVSLNWEKDIIVITTDSLSQPLSIDPNGDIIALHESSSGATIDQIRFGNVDDSYIASPLQGQSICLEHYLDSNMQQQYFYYLDNTPTIGEENDPAIGSVNGYIKDLFNHPVADFEVHYDYDSFFGQIYVLSDSNGFFSFNEDSRRTEIEFKKPNFITQDTTMQIWPDSIISIFIRAVDTVTTIESSEQVIIKDFLLKPNFPNPFNSQTTIEFSLLLTDFVELTIFDIAGKKLETLVSGYIKSGNHRVEWDATGYATGIYIYSLKTSDGVQSRKCILMK